MTAVAALAAGLLRRHLAELRRYAFDTVMQVVGLSLLFLFLFYGARALGGQRVEDGDALPALVAGYIVFGLVISAYSSLAAWVSQEALLGALERLAMSPLGLLAVMVTEYIAGFVVQLGVIAVLLFAVMALSGQWLHLDLLTLTPLVAFLVLGVLGIGLAMSGLALVFKRVAAFANLLQFVFLSLIAAPIDQLPWLKFVPIALPNALIRQSTVGGTALTEMAPRDLLIMIVASMVHLTMGALVFVRAEGVARDRGVLGVY